MGWGLIMVSSALTLLLTYAASSVFDKPALWVSIWEPVSAVFAVGIAFSIIFLTFEAIAWYISFLLKKRRTRLLKKEMAAHFSAIDDKA